MSEQDSLDRFLGEEVKPSEVEAKDSSSDWFERLKKILDERSAPAVKFSRAYLLSASYDGDLRCAVLKFYDPAENRILLWYDTTGHTPYCFTNLTPEELQALPEISGRENVEGFEVVEKHNPLTDSPIKVTKILARDPLTIGGRPSSLRERLPKAREDAKVWEADIKYHENYLYDLGFEIGMPYTLREGETLPKPDVGEAKLPSGLEEALKGEDEDFRNYTAEWVRLLECPVPSFKFASLDIEVEAPSLDRIPNAREALYPVIAVSVVDSEGRKRVLLLRRQGVEEGSAELDENVELEFYDDEVSLLGATLEILTHYPIIVTFNGDDFDLRYLWHRAQRLGFPKGVIPIDMGRESALLTLGIHIDLYKFFFNRAIQVYAFDQKYRENTLEDVASAILGVGKLPIGKNVSELSYRELAAYCLRDAELTYQLAALEGCLTLKLILALARVSRMPVEDVSRQGVSAWIKSMMYYEHRRRNLLIPSQSEILAFKGYTTTQPVIKGKKYRGAVVIEPKSGVNFNVVVLDFASLYPSIIKRWNLSYESVRCPHPECRENRIPETPHWVCRRKRGITSLIIGSLRDLRVKWYKVKAKDKSLPQEVRSWYDVVQRTLKVVLNAAYGVFGAEHFVLYCPPVAEATASIGRYAITKTIEKAQQLGIEVIYGDTDSVFLRNPTEEQIAELVNWSERELGMELDVDKVYRYTVFSSRKKNYVGVYPDGSVDIKGLTGKKRNTPEFLKRAFSEAVGILSTVESKEAFSTAREKIKAIVKECYERLKGRRYPLEDLAFTIVLGKDVEDYEKTTPQHVKAVKALPAEAREKIGAGSVIRFVKVRRDPGVKLLFQASPEEIDLEKYVEHIQSTFEPLLEALEIDFDEILGVPKTSRLERFL
ncbi:MAG: DNA-directed DNA polymerase I [Candidatus Hecatellales archaeon]|nr:MAG: DNA-directed DNA polymerase I [Candidatus Hecatellales archaeon]